MTSVLTLLAAVLFAQQPVQVKVAEGTLEGIDESGIKAFKGVPFAAPPVGELRWKAPQPAGKWHGVRQAKEFGPFRRYEFRDKGNERGLSVPEHLDSGKEDERAFAGAHLLQWRRTDVWQR